MSTTVTDEQIRDLSATAVPYSVALVSSSAAHLEFSGRLDRRETLGRGLRLGRGAKELSDSVAASRGVVWDRCAHRTPIARAQEVSDKPKPPRQMHANPLAPGVPLKVVALSEQDRDRAAVLNRVPQAFTWPNGAHLYVDPTRDSHQVHHLVSGRMRFRGSVALNICT